MIFLQLILPRTIFVKYFKFNKKHLNEFIELEKIIF